MKPQEFSVKIKNFTIKGLFEVNENADMMQMSIDEKWILTKEENPIYNVIVDTYLQLKTGMPFNFDADCCVLKENNDTLFVKYENNLFYLYTANIQAIKDLSLNEAINYV
jgi:hypothetical protein